MMVKIAERIFRKMYFSRAFELEIVKAHKEKLITSPIYLSIGQESIPATLSEVLKDYYIFAQHRAHSIYLSFGGDPIKLRDELLCLDTGCLHGNGGSAMIQDLNINMIGHHGFIGENAPLATGFSLASKKKTICFLGDGSVEEDYIGPSIGFASTHKLPILFVCQDNGLSVLTKTEVRRNWDITSVASGYKVYFADVEDNPLDILRVIRDITLPAFINIRTCRHYWHVGSGQDGKPENDSLEEFRKTLINVDVDKIEQEEAFKVREIWARPLPKR